MKEALLAASEDVASPGPGAGLRAERRSRMLGVFRAAAIDRFLKHGLEATTIEEIARDVGVSRRTFFRYFASKEDVILSQMENIRVLVCERLTERPAHETPLLALRNAFKVLDEQSPAERHQRMLIGMLIDTTPSLLGQMLLRQERWEADIAQALARRLQRDGDDPLIRQTVAVAYAVFKLTSRQSRAGPGGDIAPFIDKGFDRLEMIVRLG